VADVSTCCLSTFFSCMYLFECHSFIQCTDGFLLLFLLCMLKLLFLSYQQALPWGGGGTHQTPFSNTVATDPVETEAAAGLLAS
jgi:hypothetical protein